MTYHKSKNISIFIPLPYENEVFSHLQISGLKPIFDSFLKIKLKMCLFVEAQLICIIYYVYFMKKYYLKGYYCQ
jgi:hypothetical protein